MTMTDTTKDTKGTLRPLTPEEIGVLVRTVRVMQGWTQETLAELSGLQTRTIQRVEQGQPSSLDTRRALARAFRLDDLDYFSSLRSFPTDEELQKQKEAFEREHVLLDARVVDGRQLMGLMQDTPGFGALSAGSTSELPHAAQDAFARIVDYVRDCLDIFDVASQTEILSYGDDIDGHIAELREAGFCLCAAFRRVNLAVTGAEKPTPLPCQITYLLASPKDQLVTKVAVSRKVSGA
jgi:transcriptional regulator with XRE-family HTH domain